MKYRPAISSLNFEDLKRISVQDFSDNTDDLSPEELCHIFEQCGALWFHSGDPKAPHAELTSGKCSNSYVDVLRVLRYTNLCQLFGLMMARKLIAHIGHNNFRYSWVIGSDHAAATISYAVASWLGLQHDFTEKGPNKTQVWKRFVIRPDEVVLQVEDLITTIGTLKAVREGVIAGTPHPVKFAPVTMTLIHRSDQHQFEGSPILYLAHFGIQTWEPKDCPLCPAGSERILADEQNWGRLTGK